MGLDLLDLSYRIEKNLGVSLSAEDWTKLVRENDVEVGDLYALVLTRLQLRETVRHDVALNRRFWEQLRVALARVAGDEPEPIELATELDALFPRTSRRQLWDALQATCIYAVPELDYPRIVVVLGATLAITWGCVELHSLWRWVPAGPLWPALGFLGLWIIFETHRKLLRQLSRYRTEFPQRIRSVKDLCRMMLAINLRQVADECEVRPTGDDRAVEIWEDLRGLLVEVLDVDAREVTFRSRLRRDLGAE